MFHDLQDDQHGVDTVSGSLASHEAHQALYRPPLQPGPHGPQSSGRKTFSRLGAWYGVLARMASDGDISVGSPESSPDSNR